MLTNCPLGKKETHACWECLFNGHRESNIAFNVQGKKCTHPDYKETMKVKPHKVTRRSAFCEHCGKKVEFYLDWMGCVWPTDKGIVSYRELEAHCPHCYREIYVPAVHDINVYRRNKAYAEKVPEQIVFPIASGKAAKAIEKMMQMQLSEESERGKEILKEMFEGKER